MSRVQPNQDLAVDVLNVDEMRTWEINRLDNEGEISQTLDILLPFVFLVLLGPDDVVREVIEDAFLVLLLCRAPLLAPWEESGRHPSLRKARSSVHPA